MEVDFGSTWSICKSSKLRSKRVTNPYSVSHIESELLQLISLL